jgi:hypothetical protein
MAGRGRKDFRGYFDPQSDTMTAAAARNDGVCRFNCGRRLRVLFGIERAMSIDTGPKHVLASEVAALRREVGELRREVARLIHAGARQEDAHRALQRAFQQSRQQLESRVNTLDIVRAVTDYRLELGSDAMDRLGADIKHQRRTLEDCYQWTDAHLRDLQVWVASIGERAWPKMSAFFDEIQRVFPRGWAFVSDHRLAKKLPRNG